MQWRESMLNRLAAPAGQAARGRDRLESRSHMGTSRPSRRQLVASPVNRHGITASAALLIVAACYPSAAPLTEPQSRPVSPPPASHAATQPATQTATEPSTAPASQASLTEEQIRKLLEAARPKPPKRPKPTWTQFRAAFEDKADADIDSQWTGGRRLEVKTQNVRTMVIDFAELPKEAPKRGPWNLQIDGQGIEVTGRRGRYLELSKSETGTWRVTGPAPKN